MIGPRTAGRSWLMCREPRSEAPSLRRLCPSLGLCVFSVLCSFLCVATDGRIACVSSTPANKNCPAPRSRRIDRYSITACNCPAAGWTLAPRDSRKPLDARSDDPARCVVAPPCAGSDLSRAHTLGVRPWQRWNPRQALSTLHTCCLRLLRFGGARLTPERRSHQAHASAPRRRHLSHSHRRESRRALGLLGAGHRFGSQLHSRRAAAV